MTSKHRSLNKLTLVYYNNPENVLLIFVCIYNYFTTNKLSFFLRQYCKVRL